MRRSLVLCLVLLVGVAVGRDGEQFIDELSELRAGFDGGSTTGASPAEFAQALREAARQPDQRNEFFQPPPPLSAPESDFQPPIPPQPERRWAPVAPPQPYSESRPSPRQRLAPPPHSQRQAGRPTPILLRESAFELDRIAHQLEMASLFAEADEVRSAAGKLRKAARGSKESGPATLRPSEPVRSQSRIAPPPLPYLNEAPSVGPGPAPTAAPGSLLRSK